MLGTPPDPKAANVRNGKGSNMHSWDLDRCMMAQLIVDIITRKKIPDSCPSSMIKNDLLCFLCRGYHGNPKPSFLGL